MTRVSTTLVLAWVSVATVVSLGAWGWSIDPGHPGRWAFVAFFAPGLWAFCELAQGGDRSRERTAIIGWHRSVVGWIGLMMLLTVGPKLAIATGLLDGDSWLPFLSRIRGLAVGVSLAVWGNLLPKLLSPWQVEDEPFDWQRVHRFVGWIAALAGVVVTLVWLTLPLGDARSATLIVVGVFLVLALGRKLLSLATHRPPTPRRTSEPLGAGASDDGP